MTLSFSCLRIELWKKQFCTRPLTTLGGGPPDPSPDRPRLIPAQRQEARHRQDRLVVACLLSDTNDRCGPLTVNERTGLQSLWTMMEVHRILKGKKHKKSLWCTCISPIVFTITRYPKHTHRKKREWAFSLCEQSMSLDLPINRQVSHRDLSIYFQNTPSWLDPHAVLKRNVMGFFFRCLPFFFLYQTFLCISIASMFVIFTQI